MRATAPAPISSHMMGVVLGSAFVHVPCTGVLLDQVRYSEAVNCGCQQASSSTVSQQDGRF